MKNLPLLLLCLLCAAFSTHAATFTVTSNVDGPGSLFEAITSANATPGTDIISFAGMGTTSIVIAANLPRITETVIIDGTTANGYDPTNPPITIFGNNGIGFDFNNVGAAGSQVLGLKLQNHGTAINLHAGVDDILIDEVQISQGSNDGIFANGVSNLTIANSTINTVGHIGISLTNSDQILIDNCHIGVSVNGLQAAAIGNDCTYFDNCSNGVVSNCVIGGAQNGNHGLRFSQLCSDFAIFGNFVGVGAGGSTNVGNNGAGINIQSNGWTPGLGHPRATGCSNFRIGGLTADSSNVFSGNFDVGIRVGGAENIAIVGNIVGLSANGTQEIGNGANVIEGENVPGIWVNNTLNCQIGGTEPGARNIISGNIGDGIRLWSANENVNIEGNYIGVDPTGTIARPNRSSGIWLRDQNTNVTIGGNDDAARNVISSNLMSGIYFVQNMPQTTVLNNYIGTDVTGSNDLGNRRDGIQLDSICVDIQIQDNVISFNDRDGIRAFGNSNDLNITGNHIGVTADGMTAAGNAENGIQINQSSGATIGGSSPTNRNVIAASGIENIWVSYLSDDLTIQGNYVGLNASGTGTAAFGSGSQGIRVDGFHADFPNDFSPEINDVQVLDNYVGFSGQINPNAGNGIEVGSSANGVTIQGNYVGFLTDNQAAPNREHGIYLHYASDAFIGGANDDLRNVVGNSENHGINVSFSHGTTIYNNYSGVAEDGVTAASNNQSGLLIYFSFDAIVGGDEPNQGNIFSANKEVGIDQVGGARSIIQGNRIGLDINGNDLGNYQGGILFEGADGDTPGFGAILNQIGGPGAAANEIAYSKGILDPDALFDLGTGFGIGIRGEADMGNFNWITQNAIFCNEGIGIDLNIDDATPEFNTAQSVGNDAYPTPSINGYSTGIQTYGTANPGDTVEVFANPSGCGCEGEVYLGKTLADSNGDWSLDHAAVVDSSTITAVAIEASQNTSEFSSCCRSEIDNIWLNADGSIACEADQIVMATGVVGQTLVWELFNGTDYDIVSTINDFNTSDTLSHDFGLAIGSHQIRLTVSTTSAEGEDCSKAEVFNFDIGTPASATIDGPTAFCPGQELSFTLNSSDVFTSVDWELVSGDASLENPSETGVTIAVDDDSSTPIVLAVSALGGCNTVTDTITITPSAAPEASFSWLADTVCSGSSAELSISNTSGTAIDVFYSINGIADSILSVTNTATISTSPAPTSEIIVSHIVSAEGCTSPLNASYMAQTFEPNSASNITYTCLTATTYEASLEVTGDIAPTAVAGASGTLTGSNWVSDPLDNGSYALIITNNEGCESPAIDLNFSCDCTNGAEPIPSTSTEACVDEAINWTYDLNTLWTNDGNDTILFVLHTGSGTSIENAIDTLSVGQAIVYDASTMSSGTTYYLSPVIGDQSTSGIIDVNDVCYTIVSGMSVSFNELPEVAINAPDSACFGEDVSIAASGGSSYLWSNSATTANINWSADASMEFMVTATNSSGCSNTASASVVVSSPIAFNSPTSLSLCEGESLDIDPGVFDSYVWSTAESSPIITVNAAGSYTVSVSDDFGCEASQTFAVDESPEANVNLSTQSGGVCYGSDISFEVNIASTGERTFNVMLTADQVNFAEFSANNGNNTLTITPDSTIYPTANSVFTFVITDASGCDHTPAPDEDQVAVEVLPSPSISGSDLLVCNENDDQDLTFELLGSDVYTVWMNINGMDTLLTDVPGPELTFIQAEEGTYQVDSLVGQNGCPEFPNSRTTVTVEKSNLTPAAISYFAHPSCAGTELELTSNSTAEFFEWKINGKTFSSLDTPDPIIVNLDESNNIELLIGTSAGCADSTSLSSAEIMINSGDTIIPNVFSPGDNDGMNDYLTLDPNDYYDGCIQFIVYNRWGETIFDNSADLSLDQWDGTNLMGRQAPEGTYYYIYSVGEQEMEPKFVTLFR